MKGKMGRIEGKGGYDMEEREERGREREGRGERGERDLLGS